MKHIKKFDTYSYFENFNPTLKGEVLNYIETNKRRLFTLFDKNKSDEENEEVLVNLFLEYPELMNSEIDLGKIKTISPISGIKNMAPTLMNIGGVKDFKSF